MEGRGIQCSNDASRLKPGQENQQWSYEEMGADSDSGDRTSASLRSRPAMMGCAKRLSVGSNRRAVAERFPARGKVP